AGPAATGQSSGLSEEWRTDHAVRRSPIDVIKGVSGRNRSSQIVFLSGSADVAEAAHPTGATAEATKSAALPATATTAKSAAATAGATRPTRAPELIRVTPGIPFPPAPGTAEPEIHAELARSVAVVDRDIWIADNRLRVEGIGLAANGLLNDIRL